MTDVMTKQWYIVQTYSGFERKVAESLRQRVQAYGLQDDIGEVLIPTEDTVEMRGGRKVVTPKRFFPGYILVEMDMDNQSWHVVKETPKVTGFVGAGRNPPPMPEQEVRRIMGQLEGEEQRPKLALSFERGEEVRVVEGPLAPVVGKVEEVNPTRARVRVTVTIFGRPTSVELDFSQVEKVS